MRKILLFVICFCYLHFTQAQNKLDAYPTHWWVGMKNPRLQIFIHSKDIKNGHRVFLDPYPGVKLVKTNFFENPNYLALDLQIGQAAKPGRLHFKFMSVDMQ